ncbi:hypothetical protein BCIN_07g01850 [Botrytis cinerea B05.10]|uniref:Uncharacterized protein n=1 Tax=Botryotinia fuckeliana (strain B05.10) TaxID=332648 RepID=A0A384JLV0_BOTFB|nr:hypothetical protein BCIN_07g01850 [Botrytis cinerea B05.10]ATZ51575.1 hypothetical protein BCIN_07g01850 [Botrytis cinerea B05.10]
MRYTHFTYLVCLGEGFMSLNYREYATHCSEVRRKSLPAAVDIMFTPKLANLIHAATKVLAHYQIVGEEVSFYLKEGIANVHSTMRPGEALAHASLLLAQNLKVTVEGLAQNNASINLESWIAAPMTEAATLAIFGPKNP